jgi:nitrate/TMAO reductase-like tetraheme cytochrome c subunit
MNMYTLIIAFSTLMAGSTVYNLGNVNLNEKGIAADLPASSFETVKALQTDTMSDYLKFKKESEVKIKDNEKSISDLKKDMAKENQATKDKYNQRISKIEKKNKEMKKNIEDYKEDNNHPKWNAFKRDFSKSMDELGQSIKDLVKDYKK